MKHLRNSIGNFRREEVYIAVSNLWVRFKIIRVHYFRGYLGKYERSKTISTKQDTSYETTNLRKPFPTTSEGNYVADATAKAIHHAVKC